MFKKADIVIIAAALVSAAVFFVCFYLKNDKGTYLMITTKTGKEYIDMSDEGIYEFTTDYGVNRIEIKDGRASVIYADCKNQICVNTKEVSETGDTICCLPHRFAITVVGESYVPEESR